MYRANRLNIYSEHAASSGDAGPEVALIVSTFEQPRNLSLLLASLMMQQAVEGLLEVAVADGGSSDDSRQIVDRFARVVDFPVQFTTDSHRADHRARCRNAAVAASGAPYLLFVDDDCVLPPDFVRSHLDRRRPSRVMSGDCYRFDESTSARISEATIHCGAYQDWLPRAESQRVTRLDRQARLHNLFHQGSQPKLFGNNLGIWRSDFERVNGYDETVIDRDSANDHLAARLCETGLRIDSITRWATPYQLWQEPEPAAGTHRRAA